MLKKIYCLLEELHPIKHELVAQYRNLIIYLSNCHGHDIGFADVSKIAQKL
ncbi:MAG: hypothetical protein ACEY3J_03775 [Arsenophonus sp.]